MQMGGSHGGTAAGRATAVKGEVEGAPKVYGRTLFYVENIDFFQGEHHKHEYIGRSPEDFSTALKKAPEWLKDRRRFVLHSYNSGNLIHKKFNIEGSSEGRLVYAEGRYYTFMLGTLITPDGQVEDGFYDVEV